MKLQYNIEQTSDAYFCTILDGIVKESNANGELRESQQQTRTFMAGCSSECRWFFLLCLDILPGQLKFRMWRNVYIDFDLIAFALAALRCKDLGNRTSFQFSINPRL